MAILKLQIDDFDEIDYDLIAIHSVLEDYRLAYLINQKLPILLNKSKEEVEIHTKEGDAFFSKFTFSDFQKDVQWTLIPNKNEIIVKKKSTGPNQPKRYQYKSSFKINPIH